MLGQVAEASIDDLEVAHMGVSINGGTQKWMVYNGKS